MVQQADHQFQLVFTELLTNQPQETGKQTELPEKTTIFQQEVALLVVLILQLELHQEFMVIMPQNF